MNRLVLLPVVLAMTACVTSRPPAAVTAPAPSAVAFREPNPALRTPEVVRGYAVGAYVDPFDSRIRHDSHVIERVEADAAWNLQPAGLTNARPSDTAERIRLADVQSQIQRQREQAADLDSKAADLNQRLEAVAKLAEANQQLTANIAKLQADLEEARRQPPPPQEPPASPPPKSSWWPSFLNF